ncbi:MAG: DUF3943 domain-containing protein [Myxococcota bacterium]
MRATSALLAAVVLAASPVASADAPGTPAEQEPAPSGERERDPDYLRTFVEMTGFVALGTLAYWIQRDKNAYDWDYESWTQRFDLDAFRYDNNGFDVNFIYHALSGTSYYGVSRTNDLGVFGAFTSAFLASWTWEFLLEFREKISINDMLVTPAAGLVFGEFFYRLAQYVSSAPGGGGKKHKALRWTVGLPVAFHDWLDGETVPEGGPVDDRGFGAGIAARFRMAYGAGWADPAGADGFVMHELGFDGHLAALPGYLRPGTFGRSFTDANLTSLRFRGWLASEGTGVDMAGDTWLLGYHRQRIALGRGGGRGAAVTVGTSMTYRYRREDFGDAFVDRQALLGLPGLAIDGHVFAGAARMRLGARLHGQFGGVYSAAFPAWFADHPDERPKTILEREGYYYGWGGSGRLYGELEVPIGAFGAMARYGMWNSREGLDRSQEELTADVRGRDRALDWEAWLRLRPFDVGVFLELACMGQSRWSWVEGYRARQRLVTYQASVGWQP